MSYRYNTIDIAVGVGMCAILFGALLFFLAANGTYHASIPNPLASEQTIDLEFGMTLLQPVLGQAIVDQALYTRSADRAIALAASDWNRTTLAHDKFLSRPDGPLGTVMRQAVTIPAAHMARVQGIMGRAIVNFTTRGVRTGLLSADSSASAYNVNMIRATEARGQRLEQEFASTWQATLGRNIVEATQTYRSQAGMIQERLGKTAVAVTLAQIRSEDVKAIQQEKLGALLFAAIRTEALTRPPTSPTIVAPIPKAVRVASTEVATWPEIPLGYLIAASFILGIIFLVGILLAAQAREEKELARMRHDASRWVYHMAS